MQIKNTAEDMNAALTYKITQLKKARAVYDDESTLGLNVGMDFRQWIQTNFPAYIAADQAFSATAAANTQAVQAAYGNMGAKWTSDRNQLIAATTSTTLLPG